DQEQPKPPQPDLTPELARLIDVLYKKFGREAQINQYANNSAFETTIWDLKMAFGQYHSDTGATDWHTSITMPWLQAKICAYFLQLNVLFHEITQGRIRIPPGIIPKKPIPPTDEQLRDNPTLQAIHDAHLKIWIETFGS